MASSLRGFLRPCVHVSPYLFLSVCAHAPSSSQPPSMLWAAESGEPSTGTWNSFALDSFGSITRPPNSLLQGPGRPSHMRREPSEGASIFRQAPVTIMSLSQSSLGQAGTELGSPNGSQKVSPGLNHTNGNSSSAESVAEERGRYRTLAVVVFPIGLILAVLFEMYHFRWSEVEWSLQTDRSDGLHGSELVDNSFKGLTVGLFGRAYELGRLYFAGAGKIKGRAYVSMLICHNLFGQWLGLINFDFQRRFWNLYENPSMGLFGALITNWVILYTVMSLTAVYSSYTEQMLMIHWRDHMTYYFNSIWLPNGYALKLKDDRRFDNPDQRIHEDIGSYVGSTYGMTLGFWNSMSNLCIYGYMLFSISPTSVFGYFECPGWLFYVALAYSAFGSAVMHYIGVDLAHYDWLGERYSGNFRAELRRVYDQGETVAAMRSQDAELGRLQSRFEHIKLIKWRSMILGKKLNWFNHFYGPFSSILFMVILMPFFIRGQVDLGRIKQCEMALGQVSGSLNYFVNNYGGLASYRVVVDRLYNFRMSAIAYVKESMTPKDAPKDIEEKLLEVLASRGLPADLPDVFGDRISKMKNSIKLDVTSPALLVDCSVHEKANTLELMDATLLLPSGDALLRDINLRVTMGSCVLVCGKEGAGKSTLLRALAGIWPYMEGGTQCGSEDTMLVNQKPRLPAPMTLREAVTFPKDSSTFSDEAILEALDRVKLSALAAGGLNASMDVNSVLSGGEFQRLMIAHCILAKPRWILLDESMAHLSNDNQLAMYALLRDELVTKCGCGIVSTSHDWRKLAPFHDVHYRIEAVSANDNGAERCTGSLVPFDPMVHSDNQTDAVDARASGTSAQVIEETTSADAGARLVSSLHLRLAEKDAEIERLKQELAQAKVQAEAEEEARKHGPVVTEAPKKVKKATQAEAGRRKSAEEQESQRKAEVEAQRKAAEEEDAQRKAEKTKQKKAAGEKEAQRKAEEEAQKKAAEEESRKKVSEEILAAEAEAQRKSPQDKAHEQASPNNVPESSEAARPPAEEEVEFNLYSDDEDEVQQPRPAA